MGSCRSSPGLFPQAGENRLPQLSSISAADTIMAKTLGRNENACQTGNTSCQNSRVNKVQGLGREITLGDGCTARNGQDSFPTVALRPRNCLFSETDRPPIPGRYIAQYYRQTSYSLHGMQQPHQTVQIFLHRGIGLADWVTPWGQGTRALQTIVARLERGEGEFHARVPCEGATKRTLPRYVKEAQVDACLGR